MPGDSSATERPRDPLISEFADDPDMLELVEAFTSEMPDRIRGLDEALHAHDVVGVRHIAHQLKGSAAGYGFPIITETAKVIDQTLREDESERGLERVQQHVAELIELCQRASGS